VADKLQFVDIDKIIVGDRFRKDLKDIENLAKSIAEKGILQPITIQTDFTLCAGGRRLEAAKLAGLKKIPCLIRDKTSDEIDLREIELIENTFREDFTWQERVNLIAELDKLMREKHGTEWSTRKTAMLLGHAHPMNVSRANQLSDAMEIPELKEVIVKAKTADEAMKFVKQFQEKVVTTELRKRQERTQDQGMSAVLELAKRNYQIGDALKGMVSLRPGFPTIQFIEVDPPYGIDLGEQKKQTDGTNIVRSYNEVAAVEYQAFVEIVAEETFRVAAPACWMIFWYGPTHHTIILQALRKAGWLVDDIPAIWVKGEGGQTNAPEVHLARSYEPFFVCRKGRPILTKRGRSNVFQFSPVAATKKYHPTERPLALMEEILSVFTLEAAGQTVLVPFLGSGVTLRACYMRGLKCMGWDLSTEYKDRFLLAVEDDTKGLNAAAE
jgi:ParB/RepB/Spo0J family partition protein